MDIDLLELMKDKGFRHQWMSQKLREVIGAQIVALRKQRGMMQYQFADFVGIKQSSLSKLETGKGYPRLASLLKIARACDVGLIVRFCDWPEFIKYVSGEPQTIKGFDPNEF